MSWGEQVDPVVWRSSRLPTAVSRDRKSRFPYGRVNSLAKPDSSPRYSWNLCSVCGTVDGIFGSFWKTWWYEKVASWTGKQFGFMFFFFLQMSTMKCLYIYLVGCLISFASSVLQNKHTLEFSLGHLWSTKFDRYIMHEEYFNKWINKIKCTTVITLQTS